MSLPSDQDFVTQLYDKLLDANLAVLHATSRTSRLEHRIEAALDYLTSQPTPEVDKNMLIDLLRL